jgi:hypothetical protein
LQVAPAGDHHLTRRRTEGRKCLGPNGQVTVTDGNIINTTGNRTRQMIHVSADAGKTWRTVDLEAGSWTIGQTLGAHRRP